MKQKLFTLFALLLCVCSGAWAQYVYNAETSVPEWTVNFDLWNSADDASTTTEATVHNPRLSYNSSKSKWENHSTSTDIAYDGDGFYYIYNPGTARQLPSDTEELAALCYVVSKAMGSYPKYNNTSTTTSSPSTINGLTANSANTADWSIEIHAPRAGYVRMLVGTDANNVPTDGYTGTLSGATTGSVTVNYLASGTTYGVKTKSGSSFTTTTYTSAGTKLKSIAFNVNAGVTTLTVNPALMCNNASTSRKLLVYAVEVYLVSDTPADPVDPTITFNDASYNVGDDALDLSSLFTSNSSGAVTYSITNAGTTGATIGVDGTSFTATAAGTATVQASQAAATGYNAKTVTATIAVTNLTTPTFTVTSTADYVIGNSLSLNSLITANNSDGAVSYTVKDAGTTSASISEGVFTATAAGTAVVTIAVAASATYAAASQNVTITVMTNPLGTHTVTFALTANSANVSGSATSAKLGSFSTAFTANNLTISGNQSGYSGGIKGTDNETEYDDTKYVDIAFTVADGYTFAPTAVSFKVNPFNATGAMKYKLALMDGSNNILSDDIACAKNTDNAVTFASGAFTGKLLSGTVHIRAYFYGAASDKTVYIKSPITVSGTVAVARVVSSTDIALTDVKVNGSSITSAQLTTLKTPDTYTLTMPSTYAGEPTVVFEKTTTTTYTEGDPDVVVVDVPATMDADDDNYIATATIDEIEYTVNLPIDKTPRLEADVTEVEVASAGPATGTATIKLTGAYLTGDASVAFASSVEGLTISPATITVTSGAVDQEFTVSYQSDAAVDEANVNLTFTVGAKSVVIPVTYSSTAAITTITDVTGPKAWDFKTAAAASIESPASTRLIPLANATGFDGSFDYESLAGKAQFFYYNTYPSFQGSQLKFHTTVPGTVTVVFSNTGGSRPYRYLYVNGDATTFKSNGTSEVTSDPIAVEAGDVVLSGYIPDADDPQARAGDVVGESMLRFYSVTFTPATKTITTNAGGWTSFTPEWNATLESGATAYIITAVNDGTVEATAVDVLKAGEGYFVRGDEASHGYTATATSDDATATDGNMIEGNATASPIVISATSPITSDKYVLGTATSGTYAGQSGLFLVDGSVNVAAGKAYLDAGTTGGARYLSIAWGDGETTGIESIHNSWQSQAAKPSAQFIIHNDTPMYNLSGQKVSDSYKGIVIVNGKKYINK